MQPHEESNAEGISIHALREEGDQGRGNKSERRLISIHALREEGDNTVDVYLLGMGLISIHALREEGDKTCVMRMLAMLYFYPRPPRGGRRFQDGYQIAIYEFLSTPSARRATVSRMDTR